MKLSHRTASDDDPSAPSWQPPSDSELAAVIEGWTPTGRRTTRPSSKPGGAPVEMWEATRGVKCRLFSKAVWVAAASAARRLHEALEEAEEEATA